MAAPRPTRREFLKQSARGLGVLAVGHYASSFVLSSAFAAAPAATATRRTLVIIQLDGGNDGLNTVIPFADDNYYRLRPTLALPAAQVLLLNESLGLHPACAGFQNLFKEGKLTIVQDVGHAHPSLSHARSSAAWAVVNETADAPATGWLGRYLDSLVEISPLSGAASGLYFGDTVPLCLSAADASRVAGFDREVRLQALARAHLPPGDYPANAFGQALRNLAALIAADAAPRVAVVTLSGFDTHANQAGAHIGLLRTLSAGLHAFQRDLETFGADQRVLAMTCSEFGRSLAENENRGTGHGTTAPLFLLGSALRGGLVGAAPSLQAPQGSQSETTTDFRQVYATMLEDWLGSPAEPVLGRAFTKLDLLASTPSEVSDHNGA